MRLLLQLLLVASWCCCRCLCVQSARGALPLPLLLGRLCQLLLPPLRALLLLTLLLTLLLLTCEWVRCLRPR
jgi:hypothetical protein